LQRREKRQREKQRLRKKRGANEQKVAFEDRRAGNPLPEDAAEVFRRKIQWTARYIST